MGKLTLRALAAAILAGGLFWVAHATGAAAASLRHILRTYIALSVVPAPAAQPAGSQKGKVGAKGVAWPLSGTVTTAKAKGIAIAAPSGTLVRACADGSVSATPKDPPGVDIVVKGEGLTLTYRHVGPAYVHSGQAVRKGEVLGEIPHFGPGQTPQLVLQARRDGQAVAVLTLLGAP